MSAGRLNAAILRREASLSSIDDIVSLPWVPQDRRPTLRCLRADEEEQVETSIRSPFSRDRQERNHTSDFLAFSLAS